MQTLDDILTEHPFFKDLEAQYVHLIAGCASNVRFNGGEFIFREGEEANEFYLIRHGKVALEIFAPGRGPIIIQTLNAGEILGWSWLFPPYHWHFDAKAMELVRAIALDGRCLRDKCAEDVRLSCELLKRFALILEQRLQATRLQLLDVYGVHS